MKLEQLLNTRGLVQQAPEPNEIRARFKPNTEPVRIFYGETYDDKGNSIDSMKYYLFLSELAETLRAEGETVDPTILVADTAALRNVSARQQEYYALLGDDRANFIQKVNDTYNTGLKIVRMSEYIDSPEFIAERSEIIRLSEADPELMGAVERTVPVTKV